MSEMVQVTIDGNRTAVAKETTILEAARSLGIEIPTLCHHDEVEPYAACRICIVEVDEGRRKRVVPSCIYPIRKSITVETNNEKIRRHRKMLVQLELARCAEDEHVREMAARLGVTEPHPRLTRNDEDCILCGLCVRVCREIVGANAIGFEGRGTKRRVVAPFDQENPACIACGACAYVCPTGCITVVDAKGKRAMPRWKREVPLDKLDELAAQMLPPGVAVGGSGKAPPAKAPAKKKAAGK